MNKTNGWKYDKWPESYDKWPENFASMKHFKITDPTGIFWENRDIKTVIREPFTIDLALILNVWTAPLKGQCRYFQNSEMVR